MIHPERDVTEADRLEDLEAAVEHMRDQLAGYVTVLKRITDNTEDPWAAQVAQDALWTPMTCEYRDDDVF